MGDLAWIQLLRQEISEGPRQTPTNSRCEPALLAFSFSWLLIGLTPCDVVVGDSSSGHVAHFDDDPDLLRKSRTVLFWIMLKTRP